jgi:hypothetical protein
MIGPDGMEIDAGFGAQAEIVESDTKPVKVQQTRNARISRSRAWSA